ncbi:DUF4795 domain-containing protein [Paenibacillus sp. strain BS8-2]
MAYPQEIDQFVDKLNKKPSGIYAIEEAVSLTAGKYEGWLGHDNIVRSSIKVFTGSQLTGREATNWNLSSSTDTPWKLFIRIFDAEPMLYITYESPGDMVEAEDINRVQSAITATQTEVERNKEATDADREQIEQLKVGKADVAYVDTQLLAKADKASTYTKAETDNRIQAIVLAAPQALDTLQEIAAALDNDPDFAETITTQLAGKVDKEAGKSLTTNDYTTAEKTKLAGIAAGANAYVHPSGDGNQHIPATGTSNSGRVLKAGATAGSAAWGTVNASEIQEDASHRFVTDANMSAWNAKAETTSATSASAGLMSATDKAKLDGIAGGANAYVHPSGDGNQHVPATGTANNGRVLKAGASTGSAAWSTLTSADVGLGNVENYSVATQVEAEAGTASNKLMTPQRTAQAIVSRLESIGCGDMLKSVYDPDDDGKVTAAASADSVPWSGVSGKPTSFTPAAHPHSGTDITSGTVPAARLPAASAVAAGISQLNSATNSTSTTQAATPAAVKAAYDLAAGKLSPGVTWGQLKGV